MRDPIELVHELEVLTADQFCFESELLLVCPRLKGHFLYIRVEWSSYTNQTNLLSINTYHNII